MKRTFILAALLALAFTTKASHLSATLVIRSGNVPVKIWLDRQSAPSGTGLVHVLENLSPGHHYVEIYDLPPYHPGHGHETGRLRYKGYVTAVPGYVSTYELDRYQLYLRNERPIAAPGGCSYHGQGHGHCTCVPPRPPHCATGYGHPIYNPISCPVCGQACGYTGGYGTCYGTGGYDPHPYGYHSPWYGYTPSEQFPYDLYDDGHRAMSEREFRDLLLRMDREITDASKVSAVVLYLGDRKLSTAQVRKMIQELYFDKQKLELARAVYPQVVDPQHYGELESEFYFTTYKKQLDELIADARQGL